MLRSTRKRRMGTSAASALQQPTLAYPHAKRRRDNSSESSGDGDVNQSSDAGNSPTFSTTSPTSNVRRSRRSQSESSDSSSSAVQAGGVPIQPVVPQVPAPQPPPVANPTPVVVPAAAPPQPHIPQPPVQPMVVAAANVGVPLLPQPPVPQPPVQPMIVAAANVGVPLLPPLPPLPPQQNAIARRRDDLLWYLMARKHIHGLSKKDFDYIFLDSDSLKGGLQQVTKEDVLSLEAETLRPYHRSVFYRCMCGTDVNTEAGDCGNRLCDGHLKKRGTVSERVRFSSFDISEQLAEIVSAEFGSILAHRERLHGNRTADNDEYRNSRDFKNRVESAADFANKKLKLVLLLNSDGFSPDGNYEGSIWPVILAIADVEPCKRYASKRLITAGLLRTPHHPTVAEGNTLMRRLLGQCRNRTVDIIHGQDLYQVTWDIGHSSCDSEAYRTLYHSTTHAGGKCLWCDVQGNRLAGAYRYPMASGNKKDDAYIRLHAALATGGFGSLTILQSICPSSRALVDLLHTYDEGLIKFLCQEMFTGKRFPAMKVNPDVRAQISRYCSMVRLPTYWTGRMHSLKDLSKACGKDMRMHSYITVPLVCMVNGVADAKVAMFTMCLVNLHRTLLISGLTKADMQEISEGLVSVGSQWDAIYGRSTSTSKAHHFFAHVPDMLVEMGNILELDTCGYEHQNSTWKKPLATQNTRGFDESMENTMLLQLRVVEEVCERGIDTVVVGLRKIFEELQHNRSKGMRRYQPFTDGLRLQSTPMVVPSPNDPPYHLFNEVLQQLGGQLDFFSRIWWRGATLATHVFWNMPVKSQQDVVACTRNGQNHLGTVKLFAKNNNDLYVLLSLFDTSDISCRLRDDVRRLCINGANPDLLELLEVYQTFVSRKQFVRKIIPGGPGVLMLFNVNEISARGCVVPYFNTDYFVVLPSREVWN